MENGFRNSAITTGETVEQERRDILNSPDPAEYILARDTKIVKTATAHQRAINAAIAKLNGLTRKGPSHDRND